VTSLVISYTGEQWRHGGGTGSDQLDFQYSTDATNLTNGSWTDVDQLDFVSPITTGAARSLNGNAAANRTVKSFTIPVSITDGTTFRIRLLDFDRGGSAVADSGLAVDDFSLTAVGPDLATAVSIWNWTTSSWATPALATATVGSADVTVANGVAVPASPPGSWSAYVGTGANKGFVRVRVLTTGAGANFVTGGNLMKLVYDAP